MKTFVIADDFFYAELHGRIFVSDTRQKVRLMIEDYEATHHLRPRPFIIEEIHVK